MATHVPPRSQTHTDYSIQQKFDQIQYSLHKAKDDIEHIDHNTSWLLIIYGIQIVVSLILMVMISVQL